MVLNIYLLNKYRRVEDIKISYCTINSEEELHSFLSVVPSIFSLLRYIVNILPETKVGTGGVMRI